MTEYQVTFITVDIPEAQLLTSGVAPLEATIRLVPPTRAAVRLAYATHAELRANPYDLIHSQGATAALAAWLGSRLSATPHVVTLHETFHEGQFAGAAGKVKRRLLQQVFNNVDALIAVSEDARENLLRHFTFDAATKQNIHVIHNGVAVDSVVADAAANPANLRAANQIDDDTLILGYVGRFMPEKGFDVLVEAVRLLGERRRDLPKFVLIALNDGAFVREYRQRVAELGLSAQFIFSGFKSSAAGTIAELDALVVPSRREAFCLVAMEAMVLGCPLIASDCIGLREVTPGTPALTSVSGDAGSLADVIADFLGRRTLIKSTFLAFQESAAAKFDSSLTAASLTAVFDQVLRKPPLHHPRSNLNGPR